MNCSSMEFGESFCFLYNAFCPSVSQEFEMSAYTISYTEVYLILAAVHERCFSTVNWCYYSVWFYSISIHFKNYAFNFIWNS